MTNTPWWAEKPAPNKREKRYSVERKVLPDDQLTPEQLRRRNYNRQFYENLMAEFPGKTYPQALKARRQKLTSEVLKNGESPYRKGAPDMGRGRRGVTNANRRPDSELTPKQLRARRTRDVWRKRLYEQYPDMTFRQALEANRLKERGENGEA